MSAKPQKLVAGETMGRADREREIREAIEKIFEGGCPSSILIMADMTGRQTVRVQAVGAIADLRALLVNGVPQLVDMIDRAVEPGPIRRDD
jgi:hypothetical protein